MARWNRPPVLAGHPCQGLQKCQRGLVRQRLAACGHPFQFKHLFTGQEKRHQGIVGRPNSRAHHQENPVGVAREGRRNAEQALALGPLVEGEALLMLARAILDFNPVPGAGRDRPQLGVRPSGFRLRLHFLMGDVAPAGIGRLKVVSKRIEGMSHLLRAQVSGHQPCATFSSSFRRYMPVMSGCCLPNSAISASVP